jgi:uncharacterized tellurite resistance protein B-like protein
VTAAISDVATYAASAIASRWNDSTGTDLRPSETDEAVMSLETGEDDGNYLAAEEPANVVENVVESHLDDLHGGSYSEDEPYRHGENYVAGVVTAIAEDDDPVTDAIEMQRTEDTDDDHRDVVRPEMLQTMSVNDRQEKDKDFYAESPSHLDLNTIVYEGDRDAIQELLEEPAFFEVWHSIHSRGETYHARRDLFKSALRLTPAMAPVVYRIAEKCRRFIGLTTDLEFYVYQDSRFNASVYPSRNGRINILLTSSLLENFTEGEMEFVIGHEIGHFLLRHYDFPVAQILYEGGGQLSALQAMKLYSWKRNAEVSADRIGFLLCQDFVAAGRAFFKLSSGITDDSLTFQLSDYLEQYRNLQADMDSDVAGPEDWYSTHPFSPLRIKALQIYQASESYHSAIGEDGGSITAAEMDQQIREIMSIMEPSYLEDDAEGAEEIQRFIFFAGYAIAAANGQVEEAEVESLRSLIPEVIFKSCMDELVGDLNSESGFDTDVIFEKVAGLAERVTVEIPLIGRLNVIKDLAILTYADGAVDRAEAAVLYGICGMLGIHAEFADRVLHDAGQSID